MLCLAVRMQQPNLSFKSNAEPACKSGGFFYVRNMSKYRRAAKIDDNQNEIVSSLRQIPGVTVEPGHDDILVGFAGQTYWFEIKRPDKKTKSGDWKSGAIKPDQIRLQNTFSGHYKIVCSTDEILSEIGIS